jgi:hypothetical protein
VVFQQQGFSLARAIDFHVDPFQHRIQIAGNLGIPEPDDTISFSLKPSLSLPIVCGGLIMIMMPAVEFDDQMLGGTEEVDDVGTDRRLTSEVRSLDWKLL